MSVVWSGNLTKKGGGTSFFGRTSWKKRFFRLMENGTLCYFPNDKSSKMKGQLDVREVYVPHPDTVPKGKTHYFEIRCVEKGGGRTLAVCAEDAGQMDDVVQHLRRITAAATNPENSISGGGSGGGNASPHSHPPHTSPAPTSPGEAKRAEEEAEKALTTSPVSNSSSHTMSLPRSPSPHASSTAAVPAGRVAVTPPSLPSRGVPALPPGLGLRPEDVLGGSSGPAGSGAGSGGPGLGPPPTGPPVIPGSDRGEPPLFNLDIRLKTGDQVMVPYYRGVDPNELAATFGQQYELSGPSVKKLAHVIRANLQRVAATDPTAMLPPSTAVPAAPPQPPPVPTTDMYDPSRSALDQFDGGGDPDADDLDSDGEDDGDDDDRRGRHGSGRRRRGKVLVRHGSSASGFSDRGSVRSHTRGRSRSVGRSRSSRNSRSRSASRRRTGSSSKDTNSSNHGKDSGGGGSRSKSRGHARPASRAGSPESVGRSSYVVANRKGRYTKSRMPATAHERERLVSTPEPMIVDPKSSQERPEWRPTAGAPTKAAMWDLNNSSAWSVASPDRRSRLDGAASVGSPAQSVDPRTGRKGRFQRRSGGSRKPAVPSRFASVERDRRGRSRSRSRSKSRGRVRVKVGSSASDAGSMTGGGGPGSTASRGAVGATAGLLDVDDGVLNSDLDDTPKASDNPAPSRKSTRRGRSASVGRMRPVSSSLLAPTIASAAKNQAQDDEAVATKRGGHRSRSRGRHGGGGGGDKFSYVKPRIYQAAEDHVKSARTRREAETRIAERLKDATFGPPPPLPAKKTPSIMSLQRPLGVSRPTASRPQQQQQHQQQQQQHQHQQAVLSPSSAAEVERLQEMVRDGYAKIESVERMAATLEDSMTQLRDQLRDKGNGDDPLSPDSSQLHDKLLQHRQHQDRLQAELETLKTSVRSASLSLSSRSMGAAVPPSSASVSSSSSPAFAQSSAGAPSPQSPQHILNWGTGEQGAVMTTHSTKTSSSDATSSSGGGGGGGGSRRRVPPLPLLDPASVQDSPPVMRGSAGLAAAAAAPPMTSTNDDGDDTLDELGLPDEEHPLSTGDDADADEVGLAGVGDSVRDTGRPAATTTTSMAGSSMSWGMLAPLSDDDTDEDDDGDDADEQDLPHPLSTTIAATAVVASSSSSSSSTTMNTMAATTTTTTTTTTTQRKVMSGGYGGNLDDVDSDESDPDEVVFGDDDDDHFDELGLADLGPTY